MTGFMLAITFLTSLPLGKGKVAEPREMAASMAFFPLVGLWLGAMLWALDYALLMVMPPLAASAVEVAFLALITGGLHLDGFADSMDGLFSGHSDKERVLAIMKDSRVGAMGVVGLICLLTVKLTVLAGLTGVHRGQALLIAPALARWSQVLLAVGADYARKENSLARPFVEFLEWRQFAVATVFAAGAALFLTGPAGLISFAVAGVFTFLARLYFARKLGGVTGDTIGAVSEVNEVFVLLAFLTLSGIKF